MEQLIPQNEPAPEFILPDLKGTDHALTDYRGKVVVLNFWSAECPWSKRADEMFAPKIAGMSTEIKFLSIASNIDEPLADLVAEAGRRGIDPLLVDKDHTIADRYHAQTTPHYFVIDREGTLRFQGSPDNATFRQREATEEYLLAAIHAVLAGGAPDPDWSLPYGCTIVRHPIK
jgi:peroxiredoxin